MNRRAISDQRGFILVMGIVMGAIMVGALWQIVSAGEAIIYRERLQDAADATALENAVTHARGMNVIAMINLLMAALLSLVVALRVLILILVLCLLIPGAQPAIAPALQIANQIDTFGTPAVHLVLKGAHFGQRAIATAMPVLATYRSHSNNKDFYFGGAAQSSVVPISTSLIPSGVEKLLIPGSADRLGILGGPSLPVEKEDSSILCKEAAQFYPNQMNNMLQRYEDMGLHGIKTAAELIAQPELKEWLAGFVGEYAPFLVCDPRLGKLGAALAKQLLKLKILKGPITAATGAVSTVIGKVRGGAGGLIGRVNRGLGAKIAGTPGGAPTGPPEFLVNLIGHQIADLIRFTSILDPASPAAVWGTANGGIGIAQNGNAFLYTWAWAGVPNQRDKRWTHQLSQLSSAASEYYFDCQAEWSEKSCRVEALWRMGWTARLRRFRTPLEQFDAGQFAGAVGVNVLNDLVAGIVNKRVAALTTSRAARYTMRAISFVLKRIHVRRPGTAIGRGAQAIDEIFMEVWGDAVGTVGKVIKNVAALIGISAIDQVEDWVDDAMPDDHGRSRVIH